MARLVRLLAVLAILLAAAHGAGAAGLPVHDLAASPDGSWAVVAGPGPGVRLVELGPDGEPRVLRRFFGDRSVDRVALSPDGRRLAASDRRGWLEVVRLPQGELIQAWEDLADGDHQLVFRNASRLERVARAGGVTDTFHFDLVIPGLTSPTALAVLATPLEHPESVLVPALSRDGSVRVLIEMDPLRGPMAASAIRTDGARAALPCVPPPGGHPVVTTTFAAGHTEDGRLCVVDLTTGRQPLLPPRLDVPVAAFTFLEDDRSLAMVLEHGALWTWNLATGATLRVGATRASLSPAATLVAVPGGRLLRAEGDELELLELPGASPRVARSRAGGSWLSGL